MFSRLVDTHSFETLQQSYSVVTSACLLQLRQGSTEFAIFSLDS